MFRGFGGKKTSSFNNEKKDIALAHSNSKPIFHMVLLLTSGFKSDPFPLARSTWEEQNVNPLSALALTLTQFKNELYSESRQDDRTKSQSKSLSYSAFLGGKCHFLFQFFEIWFVTRMQIILKK